MGVSCELQRAAMGCVQLEMILNGFGTVVNYCSGSTYACKVNQFLFLAPHLRVHHLTLQEILSGEKVIFLYNVASGIPRPFKMKTKKLSNGANLYLPKLNN